MDLELEIDGPQGLSVASGTAPIKPCDVREVMRGVRNPKQKAWMELGVAVALEQERAGYGDAVLERCAQQFGHSRSYLGGLSRIARAIVIPRIANEGPAACFPLREIGWYRGALTGPSRGRTALRAFEEAEAAKLANPKLTLSRWNAELGINASGTTRLLDAASKAAVQMGTQPVVGRGLVPPRWEIGLFPSSDATPMEAVTLCVDTEIAELLGRTPEEMIGKSPFPHLAHADQVKQGIADWLSGDADRWWLQSSGRIEALHSSGRHVFLALSTRSLADASGRPRHVVLQGEYPPSLRGALGDDGLFSQATPNRSAWVVDLDGSTAHAPDSVAKALGYQSCADLAARPFWQHVAEPEEFKRAFGQIARNELPCWPFDPETGALRLRHSSGVEVCRRFTVSVLSGPNGRPRQVALDEEQDRERGPIRLAPHEIFVIDVSGKFASISATLAARIGYHPRELVGVANIYDMHADPQALRDGLSVLSSGGLHGFDASVGGLRIRNKQGDIVSLPIGFEIIHAPDGKPLGYLGYSSWRPPVTVIPRPSDEGCWDVDAYGRTTFISKHLAEALGYDQTEMLGKSVFPIHTDSEPMEAALHHRRETGANWAVDEAPLAPYVARFEAADGRRVSFRCVSTMFFTRDGEMRAVHSRARVVKDDE